LPFCRPSVYPHTVTDEDLLLMKRRKVAARASVFYKEPSAKVTKLLSSFYKDSRSILPEECHNEAAGQYELVPIGPYGFRDILNSLKKEGLTDIEHSDTSSKLAGGLPIPKWVSIFQQQSLLHFDAGELLTKKVLYPSPVVEKLSREGAYNVTFPIYKAVFAYCEKSYQEYEQEFLSDLMRTAEVNGDGDRVRELQEKIKMKQKAYTKRDRNLRRQAKSSDVLIKPDAPLYELNIERPGFIVNRKKLVRMRKKAIKKIKVRKKKHGSLNDSETTEHVSDMSHDVSAVDESSDVDKLSLTLERATLDGSDEGGNGRVDRGDSASAGDSDADVLVESDSEEGESSFACTQNGEKALCEPNGKTDKEIIYPKPSLVTNGGESPAKLSCFTNEGSSDVKTSTPVANSVPGSVMNRSGTPKSSTPKVYDISAADVLGPGSVFREKKVADFRIDETLSYKTLSKKKTMFCTYGEICDVKMAETCSRVFAEAFPKWTASQREFEIGLSRGGKPYLIICRSGYSIYILQKFIQNFERVEKANSKLIDQYMCYQNRKHCPSAPELKLQLTKKMEAQMYIAMRPDLELISSRDLNGQVTTLLDDAEISMFEEKFRDDEEASSLHLDYDERPFRLYIRQSYLMKLQCAILENELILSDVCSLPELWTLSHRKRKVLFCDHIDINLLSYEKLPKDLQLVMIVVQYWYRNSKGVDWNMIYTFFATFIMFYVIDPRIHSLRKTQDIEILLKGLKQTTRTRCGLKDTSLQKLVNIINDADDYACAYAALNLAKYHASEPPLESVDQDVLQTMSELQVIYNAVAALNSIMGSPFFLPSIHRVFNSTFFYRLLQDVRGSNDPSMLMSELLGANMQMTALLSCIYHFAATPLDLAAAKLEDITLKEKIKLADMESLQIEKSHNGKKKCGENLVKESNEIAMSQVANSLVRRGKSRKEQKRINKQKEIEEIDKIVEDFNDLNIKSKPSKWK